MTLKNLLRSMPLLLLLAVSATPTSVWAQKYPSRAITLVCPFPPGGSADILARLTGQKLSEALGVPVIDPSIAAFKRAEYAAILKRDCGWTPSRKWSCESPPEAEMAAIGGFDVNLSGYEDDDLFLRIFEIGKVFYLPISTLR